MRTLFSAVVLLGLPCAASGIRINQTYPHVCMSCMGADPCTKIGRPYVAEDDSCCADIEASPHLQIVLQNWCAIAGERDLLPGFQCKCSDMASMIYTPAPTYSCDGGLPDGDVAACDLLSTENCLTRPDLRGTLDNIHECGCPTGDAHRDLKFAIDYMIDVIIPNHAAKTGRKIATAVNVTLACWKAKYGADATDKSHQPTCDDYTAFMQVLATPDVTFQMQLFKETEICAIRKKVTGAYGDPHVRNVLHESFDINRVGTMKLIEFPRASGDHAFLQVVADIQPAEKTKPCAEKYILGATLTGKWLGTLGEISFSGQPWNQYSRRMGMRIRGGQWIDHDMTLEKLGNATSVKLAPQIFAGIAVEGRKLGWKLRIRNFRMEVMPRKNQFLDLRFHLPKSGQVEVGGLLGVDPHQDAEKQPESCK